MKIEPNSLPRTPFIRRERTAETGRFQMTGSAASATSAKSIGLLSGVEGLFALQEVADPLERRRRGQRHGHALLDRLEKLRLGLLSGTTDAGELDQLRAGAAAQREQTDDPVLEDLLGQIELRVAVELAKRER